MEVPAAAHGVRVTAAASGQVIDQVARLILGATRRVVAEHFVYTDPAVVSATHTASWRGAAGTFVGDAEMMGEGRIEVPRSFQLTAHGNTSWKLHTKLTTVDGRTSIISTAGMSEEHRVTPSLDFAIQTSSTADATLLNELTIAAASGDQARIFRAAYAAAQAGYFLNDPANGVLLLRDALKDLADATTGDAFVGAKVLNDHKILRRFADAARAAGGKLRAEAGGGTQDWLQVQEAGEQAGVKVHRLRADGAGLKLHGNVVAAQTAQGPRMIIMTAPFTLRGLGQRGAPRLGREIGVMLDDPAQIRSVLERMSQLEGSRAGKVAASYFGVAP